MIKVKLQSEYDDLDKYLDAYDDILYFKEGTWLYHNTYGPAYIGKNGYKAYLIEDKYHRLDGPAIIFAYGEERYYIYDKPLSKENFEIHPERLKYLDKEYLICLG